MEVLILVRAAAAGAEIDIVAPASQPFTSQELSLAVAAGCTLTPARELAAIDKAGVGVAVVVQAVEVERGSVGQTTAGAGARVARRRRKVFCSHTQLYISDNKVSIIIL